MAIIVVKQNMALLSSLLFLEKYLIENKLNLEEKHVWMLALFPISMFVFDTLVIACHSPSVIWSTIISLLIELLFDVHLNARNQCLTWSSILNWATLCPILCMWTLNIVFHPAIVDPILHWSKSGMAKVSDSREGV